MAWRTALGIVALVGSGLIAGQMLAIAIAKHAARALPAASWTLSFQLENTVFTRTMPFALTVPFLALAASCVVIPGGARPWYVAATVMLAVVLAGTMIVNVPINDQVGGWQPGAVPADWAAVRDRWVRYHDGRTAAGIASFVLAAIATAVSSRATS